MTCLVYCHIKYFTFGHHFASDVSFRIIKHLLTRYSGNSKFIKLLTFHLRTPLSYVLFVLLYWSSFLLVHSFLCFWCPEFQLLLSLYVLNCDIVDV
jgi:hypothetical protein